MAGYVRNDTGNNIANGNVIDADDLNGEFNAVEAAFNSSTGHIHDGTAGSGGPITKIGPTQDVIAGSTTLLPKTNNTLDLGSVTFKFKDLYVDGIAYVDAINLNGTAITATAVELNYTDGVTSAIQTQLDAKQALDAELTALAGLVSAADRLPYFTGLGTAALATFSAFGRTLIDDADAAAARTTLALGTMATQAASSVAITGGSITGITDLAVADGGTGVSTLTGIVKGNGASAFSAAVAGTDYLAPAAIGVSVQAYDADLVAVAGLASNGLVARTGAGTAAVRTLTGTTDQITVTNGDGVSGNPTIAATVASQAEVRAGTDNTKLVTSLRVAEAQLGSGQTWTDVSGSRAINTTYTNSTGRPIQVSVSVAMATSGGASNLQVDGNTVANAANNNSGTNMVIPYIVIVPAGATYRVNSAGAGATLNGWWELR